LAAIFFFRAFFIDIGVCDWFSDTVNPDTRKSFRTSQSRRLPRFGNCSAGALPSRSSRNWRLVTLGGHNGPSGASCDCAAPAATVAMGSDRLGPIYGPNGGVADSLDEAAAFRAAWEAGG
jgi:hypothetical protein